MYAQYSHGLLVVAGCVDDDVDVTCRRVFDDPINSDVCIAFVISSSIGDDAVFVVRFGFFVADDADDADEDVIVAVVLVCGFSNNSTAPSATLSIISAGAPLMCGLNTLSTLPLLSISLSSAPSSSFLLLLLSFDVNNDNDDNNVEIVCFVALSSNCIVSDATNSFIVPSLLLLLFGKLTLLSMDAMLPLLPLLLAMTPVQMGETKTYK